MFAQHRDCDALHMLQIYSLTCRHPFSFGQRLWICPLSLQLSPSLLNGLDKWVRGAPYATKWSEPHISVAIVSRGLESRLVSCTLVCSIQTTSLRPGASENCPLRLFLSRFMNTRTFVSGDQLSIGRRTNMQRNMEVLERRVGALLNPGADDR